MKFERSFYRKSSKQLNAEYRLRNLERVREYQKRNSSKYYENRKLNMTGEEKKRKRAYDAERKRKSRAKQKENQLASKNSLFSTPQVEGKAIKKVRKALTESASQNTFILRKLLKENSSIKINLNDSDLSRPASIPAETIHMVQQYYLKDDNSRQSPNMHDKVKVKENDEIVEKRIKHLIYTFKELYGMFKRENPDVKISFIKFYNLKPKHVYSQSKIHHNVCCCAIHENIRCALKALQKVDVIFGDILTDNCMHENFTCDRPLLECFMNECSICCDAIRLKQVAENLENRMEIVSWSKWLSNRELEGHTTNPYCNTEKVLKTGTIEELLTEIYDQVPNFLDHEYVKMNQSEACKILIEEAFKHDSSTAVIQCDFAEKFKCITQNQTQAAHYGQMPVSIFTCAIYHRGLRQIVIVSDSEDQNKETTIPYLDTIFAKLPETVLRIEMFTDNAPTQFKNQYTMESMNTFEKKYNIKMRWNFFAEMHGKSIVDGIGGAVKSFVHRRILMERVIVKDASDFARVANDEHLNIEVYLVTKSDIEDLKKILKFSDIISKATAIKGIKKLHSLWIDEKKVGKKVEKKVLGSKVTNLT